MRRIVTIAAIVCSLVAAMPWRVPAQPSSVAEPAALEHALASAWLPLESGLILGSTQGIPISAKYELEDGVLQLSVYTLKPNPSSGDSFLEVIVDFSVGVIARVEALTDSADLSAAQNQRAAMASAKRSLGAATAEAVDGNPGYRAVSAMPGLDSGHPVAEVTLVRGDHWKVVAAPLD
jgi:hypothetical protein